MGLCKSFSGDGGDHGEEIKIILYSIIKKSVLKTGFFKFKIFDFRI